MMKKLSLILVPLFILTVSFKPDNPAYVLYTKNGKQVTYKKMVEAAIEADIVLFGELHTNPISHWLQLELTQDIYAGKSDQLVLGAEMFEADNQILIDEYFSDLIRERNFKSEARLWTNYDTDYKPLLEFARDHKLSFIATNIPRRYASMVYTKGFESLDSISDLARTWIAPLPINYDPELPGYKSMLEDMDEDMMSHVNENLPKAQAAKDATMAHFILKNWSPGQTFIHYNGDYHSRNFDGIVWHLLQENPDLKILTISTVEQDEVDPLGEDNLESADFIICVPENMTKTHRTQSM